LPCDVVELAPDQRDAEKPDEQRKQQGPAHAASGDLQQEKDAGADRTDRDGLQDLDRADASAPRAQPAARGRLQAGRKLWFGERQEPPEDEVGEDPGTVEPGGHDEAHADGQHRGAEVIREPGSDAADQPAVRRTAGPSIRRRRWSAHPTIVAPARERAPVMLTPVAP
jgi:hypothetical protein